MGRMIYEISKEEYDQAKQIGPISLIGDSITEKYTIRDVGVYEIDGSYFLTYERRPR